jgi:hypothetical protein
MHIAMQHRHMTLAAAVAKRPRGMPAARKRVVRKINPCSSDHCPVDEAANWRIFPAELAWRRNGVDTGQWFALIDLRKALTGFKRNGELRASEE